MKNLHAPYARNNSKKLPSTRTAATDFAINASKKASESATRNVRHAGRLFQPLANAAVILNSIVL